MRQQKGGNENLSNKIEMLIDSASAATSRTQRILLVIIAACTIAIIPTWNTFGWMVGKRDYYKSVLYQTKKQIMRQENEKAEAQRNGDDLATSILSRQIEANSLLLTIVQTTYSGANKIIQENVETIKSPVFGFVIDANDRGLIGGLFLSILLWLAMLSLKIEVRATQLLFSEAHKENCLDVSYIIMSSRQVFLDLSTGKCRKWLTPTMLLIFAPYAIVATIYCHDLMSLEIGLIVSKKLTYLTLISESFFLFLISVLIRSCYKKKVEMIETWNTYGAHIKAGEIKPTPR